MAVVFHHHSPVWDHHSPVWERYCPPTPTPTPPHLALSLASLSSGTSKHLKLITKAAPRDHNKSKKQWGNSPTSDLFPYETFHEESKHSDVAHVNPLFESPAPSCPMSFDCILTVATLYDRGCSRNKGGVSYGGWITSEREQVDPLETIMCGFQREVGGRESKSNFLACLCAWGSQTVWSHGKISQVFPLRGSIKLTNNIGYCVIHHRPTIRKTEGRMRVKKEWPWSHTSA